MGETLDYEIEFGSSNITNLDGVYVTHIIWPARTSYSRHKVKVPGKDGTYDFGGGTKDDYEIIIEITVLADNRSELRTRMDILGGALAGKESLSIGGDTIGEAQVYDFVGFDEDVSGVFASGQVVFEVDADD